MRNMFAAAMVLAAVMVVSPAAAQQSQARSWCYANSPDVQTIAGCTLVILSGRESPTGDSTAANCSCQPGVIVGTISRIVSLAF